MGSLEHFIFLWLLTAQDYYAPCIISNLIILVTVTTTAATLIIPFEEKRLNINFRLDLLFNYLQFLLNIIQLRHSVWSLFF